jgi:hypothetical protein
MERLKQLARIDLMEPEYAERLFPWIASKGGLIGIGSSVRFIQPVGPTFAPAGKSFHEQQKFVSGLVYFAAVDLVARNGTNVHRSPRWAEVPKQGSGHADIKDYGVHANVDGEPWHLQPIEIDGWQTWVNNNRPHPNGNFVVKGGAPPPAPTPVPTPTPTPTPTPGEIPLGSRTLKITSPTMQGSDVQWVQYVLRGQGLAISVDSYYGRQTADRVKAMQGWNGLEQDGVVGPKTWEVLKKYV